MVTTLLEQLNKWSIILPPTKTPGLVPPSAGVCCSEGQAYITEGFALTQMEKTKPAAALPWVTVARKFRS